MTESNQLTLNVEYATEKANDTTSTFADNLSLPVHRWFRYSAGFSALWARELIQDQKTVGRTRVLDPFAGSGTLLLEGEYCDAPAVGLEAHPFVSRVAQAKLHWREDPKAFIEYALALLRKAPAYERGALTSPCPRLLQRCYPTDTLCRLYALHRAWLQMADGSPVSELTWLALTSILRDCSPVGTAQWQYVLPKKAKARSIEPYHAFKVRVHLFAHDMAQRQRAPHGPRAVLHLGDARECSPVPDGWAQLVITSPPYANNYDYADATRLEMTFFREVQGWGDLQEAVRRHLLPSCTQHVARIGGAGHELLADRILRPIGRELAQTYYKLEDERQKHGGNKPYAAMVAAYFREMGKVWIALRRCTSEASLICFVVGDSAPYGIYVPVDEWLGRLALSAGFKSYRFEKTRDRNVKWKNRKHRVPLHEGRLWVEG